MNTIKITIENETNHKPTRYLVESDKDLNETTKAAAIQYMYDNGLGEYDIERIEFDSEDYIEEIGYSINSDDEYIVTIKTFDGDFIKIRGSIIDLQEYNIEMLYVVDKIKGYMNIEDKSYRVAADIIDHEILDFNASTYDCSTDIGEFFSIMNCEEEVDDEDEKDDNNHSINEDVIKNQLKSGFTVAGCIDFFGYDPDTVKRLDAEIKKEIIDLFTKGKTEKEIAYEYKFNCSLIKDTIEEYKKSQM